MRGREGGSLEKMLIYKDVPGAVAYVEGVISDLLMNKMDLSLLVISKVGRAGQTGRADRRGRWGGRR